MSKRIKVTKNGPYIVTGSIPLSRENSIADESNIPAKWEKGEKIPAGEEYHLCRCGKSKGKPFCDGKHVEFGFDGTETAGSEKFDEKAEEQVGPDLILKDNVELCTVARFCEAAGNVWNLTDKTNEPLARKKAIEECCNCPSGRLVACDKEGKEIEPKLPSEVSLVEDTVLEMSGPI